MVKTYRLSFTKVDRLLKRKSFLKLSQFGKKVVNKYFIAAFCPSETSKTRIGITVSKKVGNAVVRNNIKRKIREHFRLNRHRIQGDWDINIIAKKEISSLKSKEVFFFVQNIFEKVSKIF